MFFIDMSQFDNILWNTPKKAKHKFKLALFTIFDIRSMNIKEIYSMNLQNIVEILMIAAPKQSRPQ